MAFIRSVSEFFSGIGTPVVYTSRTNINGNQAILLPSSGNFSPVPITRGFIRIKSNLVGNNCNVTSIGPVTFYDGNASNTVVAIPAVGVGGTLYPNNSYIDQLFEFQVDIQAINCNITNIITGSNTSSTFDLEIVGTQ